MNEENIGNAEYGRFLSVDPRAEKYPEWSGYNYVIGNPIINIDPQGDTVRVYSQTIPSTGHLGRHIYARVTTENVDMVVEVWGPNAAEAARGTAIPKILDLTESKDALKEIVFDRPSVKEHDVSRPEGIPEGNTKFENDILNLAVFFGEGKPVNEGGVEKKDYINLPTYDAFDNNSNGYLNAIIEAAGGKIDTPIRAVGSDDTQFYDQKIKESNLLEEN